MYDWKTVGSYEEIIFYMSFKSYDEWNSFVEDVTLRVWE